MRYLYYSAAAAANADGRLEASDFNQLVIQRQNQIDWWSATSQAVKDRYGRVSASAVRDRERSAEMMRSSGYNFVGLLIDQQLVAFSDWFIDSMPELEGDDEFVEGGSAFFEGFNAPGGQDLSEFEPELRDWLSAEEFERQAYPTSFGRVAYWYYTLTRFSDQGKGHGRATIQEMARRAALQGADCLVADLPLRPYCGRIVRICEMLGFKKSARIVWDADGNLWEQWVLALGQRTLRFQNGYAVGTE